MGAESWPLVTAGQPAIPLLFKQRAEDFVVEELPAYAPSGEGTHVFLSIEKRELTTHEAVARVAKALGRPAHEVGYAGLKDALGVTRQSLSIEHVDPARVAALALDGLRVLSVALHGNKLKLGHSRGNRFVLALRGVAREQEDEIEARLRLLERRGLPNYFGEQRFGMRGDTWELGRALIAGDEAELVRLVAGDPRECDHGRVRQARELYERGEFEAAAAAWPGGFRDSIRAARMRARGAKPSAIVRTFDRRMLRFYVSAWQSWLFNAVVAARIGELDRVRAGDLAWKHANGAVFLVEDAEREAPRAASLEISPTGPLFGQRMSTPGGDVAAIEERCLVEHNESRERFERRGPYAPAGGRRPLRVALRALDVSAAEDQHGRFVRLAFELDSGSYATALLRELHHGVQAERDSG